MNGLDKLIIKIIDNFIKNKIQSTFLRLLSVDRLVNRKRLLGDWTICRTSRDWRKLSLDETSQNGLRLFVVRGSSTRKLTKLLGCFHIEVLT